MDKLSMQIANRAVGNAENSAVVEFTQSGASFLILQDSLLAFSGGGALPFAGDQPLPLDKPVFIPHNTQIDLKHSPIGCRLYFAVAGGWDVPETLGSRSTYLQAKLGGIDGRALMENDELQALSCKTALSLKILKSLNRAGIRFPSWQIDANGFLPLRRDIIRVTSGRERNWFHASSIKAFFTGKFQIGNNSNRMGIQINGPEMQRESFVEMLSTAVAPGSIQVTNNGEMILLMADAQTTGGYPRIAQVAAVDLPLCAQLRPGDTISFVEISHKEAEQLWLEQGANLARLALGIQQKYN
jgi:antagonist of KipI